MKCPRCQHENETGAKFCEECATPLVRPCGHCSRLVSATAKFCPECAHPTGLAREAPATSRFTSPDSYTPRHLAERILDSKAALEGERKQVTVLFADLKGSVRPGGRYTASYLQAATSPGFRTDVHQHGGPKALFTLSGEVCVETTDGKLVGRAGGEPLLINGDVPMQLTSVGSGVRRSLVLILHDAAQPWKVPTASPWVPEGLCVQPNG